MPFYAVHNGRFPGIYDTWDECKQQIHKWKGAKYKKFDTKEDAENFVKTGQLPKNTDSAKRAEKVAENQKIIGDVIDKIKEDDLVIYTDGSCDLISQVSACAIYFGPHDMRNKAIVDIPGRQTNNRAELYGIYSGLKTAEEHPLIKRVLIFTDSKYGILMSRVPRESRSGVLENTDILELIWQIIDLLVEKNITVLFNHVFGHAKSTENKIVDKMAYDAMSKKRANLSLN